MGFFQTLHGGVVRDLKIRNLKAHFARAYPGQTMRATLESYCGLGMMLALAVNDGSDDRFALINEYEKELELEEADHRYFAREAHEVGISTMLRK
jgi:hypothetical protein